MLVDQGPLWETGGSTSHAPGLVFQHNPSRTMTRFAQETVDLFDALGCFHGVGGIEVAATPERWDELHRRYGRTQSYGLPAALLEPGQVQALVPLIDPERILGGLHTPTDGIAKALRAAEAMATAAGVDAYGGCEVTGFDVERGAVRAVHTALGTIRTSAVVLAAGIWGPKVARLAGVRLPLVPVLHQYAVTEPLPELAGETREVVHPILRHQDADLYFRQVGDAYGIGNYDHEPRLVEPWEIAAPGGPGQPSMLPFTPEDFARAAAETDRLLPAVGRAPLARSFDGLMSFTPDGMPLIGEAAAARGLWLCEAIWVTHSGGAGRALAELIVRGDVRTDLHECDPQRFDTHGLSRAYARLRGAQQYREVYDVLHPRQQQEQVRLLRRTPLYPRQLELGAHCFESAGWERPQWFEANAELDPGDVLPRHAWPARDWSPIAAAEHRACRERVGLFDLTPFTKVEVRGPGALAFLSGLAANDVDRPVGTIVYTAMCAPRGGIMCDLTITRTGPRDVPRRHGRRGRPARHRVDDAPPAVGRLRPARGQDLRAVHDRRLGPAGARPRRRPRRRRRVQRGVPLHDRAGPPPRPGPGADAADLLRRRARLGDLRADRVRARAVGPAVAGGRAAGRGRVRRRRLRLAAAREGLPALGRGHRRGARPVRGRARLGGQARQGSVQRPRDARRGSRRRASRRRLRCLVLDDPSVVLVGKEPILDGDAAVGYVTSAALGASVGESIAYGYLPVERAEVGTVLSVYAEGERHAATVAAEPRFDPRNERLRDVAPAAVAG